MTKERDDYFKRDIEQGVCSFCGEPVAREQGFLNLFDRDEFGICGPGMGKGRPFAALSHTKCGPECGYSIDMLDLTAERIDAENGMLEHIREKTWFCAIYEEACRAVARLPAESEDT